MSFDLQIAGSLPGLSCGLESVEECMNNLPRRFRHRVTMVEPIAKFPEAVAKEYSAPVCIAEAPRGITYLAQDGLGENAEITEFFDPDLCLRDQTGAIVPRPGCEGTWAQQLADTKALFDRMSCLVHPALIGIEQVFHANGTVYVATRPIEGRASEFHTSGAPAAIQTASESLIDLLAYLHAFGVSGLAIRPEGLAFDPQQGSVVLPLVRALDGTLPMPRLDEDGAEDDCLMLAETLHVLLTGDPAVSPHVSLTTRCPGYSEPFLAALDRVLSTRDGRAKISAHEWAKDARGHRPRRKALLRLGLAAVLTGVIAAALLWVTPFTDDAPATAPVTKRQVEGAGPWQVELPLKVVTKSGATILQMKDPSDGFLSMNPWIQDGLVVTKINGAAADEPADLRDLIVLSDGGANALGTVSLTLRGPDLPVERTIALIPYLWREKNYGVINVREQAVPDGWQLVVTAVNEGAAIPLQPGDVLLREEVAGQVLLRLADLEQALDNQMQQTHPSLTILIRRAGSQLVVGFAAETLMTTR